MKVRKPLLFAAAAAVAVSCMPLRAAHAGAQYQATISEDDANTSTIKLTKPQGADKVLMKPSAKPGDGGVTIQLTMTDIACAGSPCNAQNHVFELWTHALGIDIPSSTNSVLVASAGLLFNVTKGKALFPNGKNVTNGKVTFGTLVTSVFTHTLGIGLIKLHGPATVPGDCGTVPLLKGNHCLDGPVYALAGFTVPVDPTLKCTADTDCTSTQACNKSSGLCVNQTCSDDSECRTTHCDFSTGTGTCCSCPGSCPDPCP